MFLSLANSQCPTFLSSGNILMLSQVLECNLAHVTKCWYFSNPVKPAKAVPKRMVKEAGTLWVGDGRESLYLGQRRPTLQGRCPEVVSSPEQLASCLFAVGLGTAPRVPLPSSYCGIDRTSIFCPILLSECWCMDYISVIDRVCHRSS